VGLDLDLEARAKTEEQREEANLLISQVSIRHADLPKIPSDSSDGAAPRLRRSEGDSSHVIKASREDPLPPPPASAWGRFACRLPQKLTMLALITQALVVSFVRDDGNSCRNSWQDPTFLSQLLA
jgi:DNA-directed RNA polymerase subunit H (RpoH/RPB5)